MNREFLTKVRSGTYEQSGRRVDLFVLSAPSPEEASILMAQWRAALPPDPIGTQVDADRMTWEEPLIGTMLVARRGRWLAGASGDATAARPLLESLLRQLN
jgi:hypothetical protein